MNIESVMRNYSPQLETIVGKPVYLHISRLTYYLTTSPDHQRFALDNVIVASFTLEKFPGCCGIYVSTGAMVWYEYRRKGIGTILNKMRIDIARAEGYGCLICTDIVDNKPQQKILAKNGWSQIHQFMNPRTGNNVHISVINL